MGDHLDHCTSSIGVPTEPQKVFFRNWNIFICALDKPYWCLQWWQRCEPTTAAIIFQIKLNVANHLKWHLQNNRQQQILDIGYWFFFLVEALSALHGAVDLKPLGCLKIWQGDQLCTFSYFLLSLYLMDYVKISNLALIAKRVVHCSHRRTGRAIKELPKMQLNVSKRIHCC